LVLCVFEFQPPIMFGVSRANRKKRAKSAPTTRQLHASASTCASDPVRSTSQASCDVGSNKRKSALFSIRTAAPTLLAKAQNRFSRLLTSKRAAQTNSTSSEERSRAHSGKRQKNSIHARDLEVPKRSSPALIIDTAGLRHQIEPVCGSSIVSMVQIDDVCCRRVARCEVASSEATSLDEESLDGPNSLTAGSSSRVCLPSSCDGFPCSSDTLLEEELLNGPKSLTAGLSPIVLPPFSRDACPCGGDMSVDRASISPSLSSVATHSFSAEVHVFMLEFAEILVRWCTCLRYGMPHIAEARHDPFFKLAKEVQQRGLPLTGPEQLAISDLMCVFGNMQREMLDKTGINFATQYGAEAIEFLALECAVSNCPSRGVGSGPHSTESVQAAAMETEEEAFWSPRSTSSGDTAVSPKAPLTPEEAKRARRLLDSILQGAKDFVLDPLKSKACENLLTLVVCELGRRSFQMCASSCTADAPIASAFCDLLQAGLGVDMRDDSVWTALTHLVAAVTGQARVVA